MTSNFASDSFRNNQNHQNIDVIILLNNYSLNYFSECVDIAKNTLPPISFKSIFDMMNYLGSTGRNILLIIDEYPYLKESGKKNEIDSYMQRVIDDLPSNVKLVLCGSYITIMKELLQEENPLFGRFTLIQHIREFDYFDAARFYPKLSINDKIAFYAVFGGSPFVLENLDYSKSLKENIKKTLLSETGVIKSHIENIMLKEIKVWGSLRSGIKNIRSKQSFNSHKSPDTVCVRKAKTCRGFY